jgi:serine/threonine protein kinase
MPDPQKLGKYEVRRQLGRGAMGIVYEGYDPFIQRTVALKTIRKELLDQERAQEMLARFQREAQAGGRLNHPNIVAIYDYGEDQDTAYIAMEFIEGKELKELFAENIRFELPSLIDIMSQLLSALNYSHQHGVVHRDIKPANIIVMTNGQVKIADFGIARLESSNLTQTGSIMGTPNYMSPEQFMGQGVDGRSDLFSAGVIFYQLLTGEKPFIGESTTTIMYQILNNTPNAPSVLNVQLPTAFDGVTRKALAKRPADRFQTGQEFIDAIKSAAKGEPFYSDVETTITNINPFGLGAKAKKSAISSIFPMDTSRKRWIGGGAVAAIAAIGSIAFLATPRHTAPPATPTIPAMPTIPAKSTMPAPLSQIKSDPVSAVQAPAPAIAGAQQKASPPPTKNQEPPPKKTTQNKKATVESPKAEQAGKLAPEPVAPAQKPQDKPTKPTEKKKGFFGEELKPSQWHKEGDLL